VLDDLRALVEFAQGGSIAGAADRLHALIWPAVKYDAWLTNKHRTARLPTMSFP
jgi:hypothetical protein